MLIISTFLLYKIIDRSNYLMLRAEGPQTAESIRMMADMVSLLL